MSISICHFQWWFMLACNIFSFHTQPLTEAQARSESYLQRFAKFSKQCVFSFELFNLWWKIECLNIIVEYESNIEHIWEGQVWAEASERGLYELVYEGGVGWTVEERWSQIHPLSYTNSPLRGNKKIQGKKYWAKKQIHPLSYLHKSQF